jgi:uncharacterized protein (TIGR02145 family)
MKNFIKLFGMMIVFFNIINAQIPIHKGWNLISIPVRVPDGHISFGNPGSPAYSYNGGYYTTTTFVNGKGYWIKYGYNDTISLGGENIYADTFAVNDLWNLVGSISFPVPVNTITSEPPGIIASKFIGFTLGLGYEEVDTIQPGKAYWVKINKPGAIILSAMAIPCPGTPTVSYQDKIYNTVQIGNQCWLKENLDVGTMISGLDTAKNNGIIEKYCYNDSIENCNTYGGLYQWNEAMQYSTTPGIQGICPIGWHIPTYFEYQTLRTTVGNNENALKAIGQGTGAGAGTNTSGFSALLAGYRSLYGYLLGIGKNSFFWSSTEYGSYDAYGMYLGDYNNGYIIFFGDGRESGFSVRCVKD